MSEVQHVGKCQGSDRLTCGRDPACQQGLASDPNQPNATGLQTKKAGRLTRPFIMLTAWRLLSNREANIVGGCVGEGLRAVLIALRGANV